MEISFQNRPGQLLTWALMVVALSLGPWGCNGEASDTASRADRIIYFVPGVGGDGLGYSGLKRSLGEAGAGEPRVVEWGAPGPFFMMNFQNRSIHESAEKKLAARLAAWQQKNPDGKIDLVGHSAGGGVILGALRRLDASARIGCVVLLSPSVSPGYPLGASLEHVGGRLHVFYSERDTLFLKWRTGTFGTYDNLKTAAAGNCGFTPAPPLPPALAAKLVQHAYDPAWEKLGNDGGHLSSTARDFVRAVVIPLLAP